MPFGHSDADTTSDGSCEESEDESQTSSDEGDVAGKRVSKRGEGLFSFKVIIL